MSYLAGFLAGHFLPRTDTVSGPVLPHVQQQIFDLLHLNPFTHTDTVTLTHAHGNVFLEMIRCLFPVGLK